MTYAAHPPKRPHQLPCKATEEERAIVCTLRRATNFPLDGLTFVVCHFLPHLNRDSVWRILKAEGLNRRPKPATERPAKGRGGFREYDLGFVHIDIKHLPPQPFHPLAPPPEQLLRGFNQAYNARRQRVPDGRTPNQVTTEHLKAKPGLANPAPYGRAGPRDATKAPLIAEVAKEVSQPDN